MDCLEFRPWYPKGIQYFLAAGANNYIALFDDRTVLKFPLVPPHEAYLYTPKIQSYRENLRRNALKGLEVEEKILNILGNHPRIVRLRHRHEAGLLLEYMPNGSVEKYLLRHPDTSLEQRMNWALQAAQSLAYVHARNILHCDISVGNLLLDLHLNIKLADFQGRLLDHKGVAIFDGGALEGAMSSMPRSNPNDCNFKTDIFALGTAIYFMITGHAPFPDLDSVADEDEVQRRFMTGETPTLSPYQGGIAVQKCWQGQYDSTSELVLELRGLMA